MDILHPLQKFWLFKLSYIVIEKRCFIFLLFLKSNIPLQLLFSSLVSFKWALQMTLCLGCILIVIYFHKKRKITYKGLLLYFKHIYPKSLGVIVRNEVTDVLKSSAHSPVFWTTPKPLWSGDSQYFYFYFLVNFKLPNMMLLYYTVIFPCYFS